MSGPTGSRLSIRSCDSWLPLPRPPDRVAGGGQARQAVHDGDRDRLRAREHERGAARSPVWGRLGAALVRESGYDALAMEAVAARAGVGKTTVYRRWASKKLLVAEAVERFVLAVPAPDTGSVEQDVLVLMRRTPRMHADPGTASLLPALATAVARSPRVAEAVRTGMVAAWHAAMGAVLRRGVARGELRADADLALATELLAGRSSSGA